MVSRYGGLSSCRASWSISLFRHPAILLTVALISACGFQLRGGRPLPDVLRSVFIEVNQEYRTLEPPIVGSLRAALRARGAEVERKERDARAKLVIEELIEQRQVISVGPDGKAIEYELTTTIQYTVKADGETVLPHQTLSLSRDYSFNADAVLAMYHDQGLPVLKYAGFGEAANVTLGLPLIRTSVDHGTALDLAASGQADAGSLRVALDVAAKMARSGHVAPE